MDFVTKSRIVSLDDDTSDSQPIGVKRSRIVDTDDWKSNDQHILSGSVDDISNNLLQTIQVAQRFSRFAGTQTISKFIDTNAAHFRENISNLLKKHYDNFDYDNMDQLDDLPIVRFYSDIRKELINYESALYPIFHGLNRFPISTRKRQRISITKPDQIKAVSSIGYPITELQIEFCDQFIKQYTTDNATDKLYGMGSNDRIMDLTKRKICKILTKLYLGDLKNSDLNAEMKKLAKFQGLAVMLEKSIGESIAITQVLQHCHINAVQSLNEIIYVESNHMKILNLIKRVKEIDESIKAKMLHEIDYDYCKSFDEHAKYKYFFFGPSMDFVATAISKCILHNAKILDHNDLTVAFVKEYTPSSLWSLATTKYINDRLDLLSKPSEDKLKEMSKFFNDIITLSIDITYVVKMLQNENIRSIFATELFNYWSSNFKRDFAGHYAYYLDYRLKAIVKSKDRIKLEKEQQFLNDGIESILPLLNMSKKHVFKRMYSTLYIQRMLNTLFDSSFTLYTNITDCELEAMKIIDMFTRDYQYGDSLMSIFDKVNTAVLRNRDFRKSLKGENHISIEKVIVAGLPDSLNIIQGDKDKKPGSVESTLANNTAEKKMKLPSEMNNYLKEYRSFLKTELKKQNNSAYNGKLLIQLNYGLSKMTIDYALEDNSIIHINCNMYHGMILSLFNDTDDNEILTDEEIANKLNIPLKIVIRSLNALRNPKYPILSNEGGDIHRWRINKNLQLTEKIKNSDYTITINDKRR